MTTVAVFGRGVSRINEVTLRQARLVLKWTTIRGVPSWSVTRCSGQLSLLPFCAMENQPGDIGSTVLLGRSHRPRIRDCDISPCGLTDLQKEDEHSADTLTPRNRTKLQGVARSLQSQSRRNRIAVATANTALS